MYHLSPVSEDFYPHNFVDYEYGYIMEHTVSMSLVVTKEYMNLIIPASLYLLLSWLMALSSAVLLIIPLSFLSLCVIPHPGWVQYSQTVLILASILNQASQPFPTH